MISLWRLHNYILQNYYYLIWERYHLYFTNKKTELQGITLHVQDYTFLKQ